MAKDKDQRLPPDGLRPPRVQELRPARHDHQAACDKLLKMQIDDPLFEIAQAAGGGGAERSVLRRAEAVSQRRLLLGRDLPRVPIGIPVQMFTVLFAMGRLPGWIAHWVEMHQKATQVATKRIVSAAQFGH
jgi:citrate synthase